MWAPPPSNCEPGDGVTASNNSTILTMASEYHYGSNSGMQIGINHGTISAEIHPPKRQKTSHWDRSSASRHDSYTIAWVCALHIEMAAARAMLDNIHESLPAHADDTNAYVLGSIKQHHIVITCLPAEQYAMNNAARVLTNLKRTFPAVRFSLMVGIGGGVPSKRDIQLGDIVVGTRVMQYDLGKIIEDGKFLRTAIPRTPDMLLGTTVSALRAKHELEPHRIQSILQQRLETNTEYIYPNAPDRLFLATYDHVSPQRGDCDECDHSKLVPRSKRTGNNIVVHYGAIASGNQVMRHGVTRDNVARELDVVCFEMESAALMDILPCLPIRGICDYSDSHKNKDWQKYAAAAAAAYARELIEELPSTGTHLEFNDIHTTNKVTSLEQREWLLESLRFDQVDSRKLNIEAEHAKTCRWLLDHPNYEEWLNPLKLTQHHGFLWISGKPGAGKSTLMKFAYLNLTRKLRSGTAIIASFFFNARGASLEKSINGMYRSLLLQLLEGYPDLQTVLNDPEVVSRSQRDCPTLNVLKKLFCRAVCGLGNRLFTCFVDALDECDEQQVVDMVRCFEDLAEQCTAKGVAFRVCFSSRHYPYIIIRRGTRLTLEDQVGHTEDLAVYVASRLVVGDVALKGELQSKIVDKAAGVFLWVHLVVDILNKEVRDGGMSLKKRLAEIPTGLSELFKDILSRDKENTEALFFCVIWVLYAERPLQPKEFYHALWAGLSQKGLTDDNVPDATTPDSISGLDKFRRYVISSSKGLAETMKGNQPTVQFIHESVRDFLVKDNGLLELWPGIGYDCATLSHDILKQCCSIYINHSSVRHVVRRLSSESDFDIRTGILEQFPFLKYASQHIFHHANAAAQVYPQDEFLTEYPISDWIDVNNLFEKFKIRRFSPNASQCYIFAERGLPELVRTIVSKNPHLCVHRRDRYRYPFFAALASGSTETVAAVLGLSSSIQNGVNIVDGIESKKTSKEYKDRTPLSWAAENGRGEIVRLLQTKQSINTLDKAGYTPLARASMNGHEAVVGLLIDKGADVHATNHGYRQTSLHCASQKGHEAVVRLLVEKGADIHAIAPEGLTPLHWASITGHKSMAGYLIEKGADVHAVDNWSRTPLHEASKNGHATVARLLIESGADVNLADGIGWTSLHMASKIGHKAVARLLIQEGADIYATYGHEAVARLLIENGADVQTIDKDELTSLHWSSKNGHEAVVRLLIENGADVQAIDKEAWTALHWSSNNGYEAVARVLIEEGADAYTVDKQGRIPLHLTSVNDRCFREKLLIMERKGQKAVARFLIEKGSDVDAIDESGKTSLHWASMNDYIEMAGLLIQENANIHAVDKTRRTALHCASQNGAEAVARFLIEKGAKVHVMDEDGWTALHLASKSYHVAVARLLIEKGADINAVDKSGRTALHCVLIRGYEAIMALLIRKGADIHLKDNNGWSSLHLAAMHGHKALVQFLIDGGADIQTIDKVGWTSFHWASYNGHEAVARLLIKKGANLHAVSETGWTSLHLASMKGFEAIGKFLIRKRADVNALDKNGRTPLHWASKNGHEAMVRLLIEKGAIGHDIDKVADLSRAEPGEIARDVSSIS
ncbi:hypothetical protein N7513_006265 [Penicillium frequentans]|nr:hypothetical protein N7513_006265 [Penicillium glabrum]